jgi:hypothetical protein
MPVNSFKWKHYAGEIIWFCCKKSGYFTKPMKNIINRVFICHKQVNNDTKSNNYCLKSSKIVIATEP